MVNERRSVSPVGAFLEEAVPVLRREQRQRRHSYSTALMLTMVVAVNMVSLVRLSMTLSWKLFVHGRHRHLVAFSM